MSSTTPTPTSPDHSAAPRRSLDPQRTDQMRTFLVVEAAADAARRPALTLARRRLAIGAASALLLAGGLVAVQAVGGSAPAAIAVEVDGEWTTVRLVDIDADPDAVVEQLRAAGFDAERETHEVERDADGRTTVTHDAGEGGAAGMMAVHGASEGGTHGIVGLSVELPDGALPPSPPTAGSVEEAPASDGPAVAVPAAPSDDALAAQGIRFEADGGISLRAGADVTIVVYTEA